MTSIDQVTVNPRYLGQFDQENNFFSQTYPSSSATDDKNGGLGRRVFLESPSLGNKEEEDMYRYVSSRLSEHTASVIETGLTTAAPNNLMDSLDLELDMIDRNNPRSQPPYRTNAQPFPSSNTRPALPNNYSQQTMSDPRQDPLLGPLLAELDAMSTAHTSNLPASSTAYQRNSVPYNRPAGPPQSNQHLANRTINDALFEAELYDSLEPSESAPLPKRPAANSVKPVSRPVNMNSNDVYLPSSYSYEPVSFLSQFGPEDQLFQRPLLNNIGQNSRIAPPPPVAQPSNYSYQRPQEQFQFEEPTGSHQRYQFDNQGPFFTDQHATEPATALFNAQHEDDSKRQAVWNDLQRTNIQKRDSASRIQGNNNRQPPKPSPQYPYRPPIGSRVNPMEDNNDRLRNKENSYQRSPTKRYEESLTKRKPNEGYSTSDQIESHMPMSNNNYARENDASPKAVAIPLNSQVNRVGDKISLNIDLKLVDLQQNNGREPSNEPPQWSNVDPLDRHIRKLERNLDQSLTLPTPPTRQPTIPSTSINSSNNSRFGKGPVRSGYNPPNYGPSNYEKPPDDDSYLAKLHYAKKNTQFKPYTSRDYEQFKKNYGFGTGHLGLDYDSTTYKEKTEKLAKTREYAQQVEARNKKKFSNASTRTWSDTRLPNKRSSTQRVTDHYDL